MKQPLQAAFKFETYHIKHFSFKAPETANNQLSMHFLPSAIYRQQEGLMSLQLDVALKDTSDNDSTAIALLLEAVFTFEETPALADIPDYFYKNSIAIVYPYIRAFITNLTATANITPLILPLLNLSVLEEELKKRTSSE